MNHVFQETKSDLETHSKHNQAQMNHFIVLVCFVIHSLIQACFILPSFEAPYEAPYAFEDQIDLDSSALLYCMVSPFAALFLDEGAKVSIVKS